MTAIAKYCRPETLIITTTGGGNAIRRAAIVGSTTRNNSHSTKTAMITVKPAAIKHIQNGTKIPNITSIITTSLLSPKQQQQTLNVASSGALLGRRNIVLDPLFTSTDSEDMKFFQVTTSTTDDDSSTNNDEGGPRKRRRLTHLSPEEKVLRRKLKNRVAAQTARDRKKAQMTDMEEAIAKLQTENKKLLQQNVALQKKTGLLVTENAQLRERLGLLETGECNMSTTTTTTCSKSSSCSVANSISNKTEIEAPLVKAEPRSPWSAVPFVSQQQKQTLEMFHSMMQYTCFVLILSLLNCCNFWMKSATQNLKTPIPQNQLQVLRILEIMTFSQKRVPIPWWGPQQHNWTPSMN